MVNIAIMKTDF